MNEKKESNIRLVIYTTMFIISALFYLTWYWHDGIIITPDAASYINMQSDREPGYCSFLWILRIIFGDNNSLHAAVVIQCIIAAIAACELVIFLRNMFSLNWIYSIGILIIQYGITLLNRFVALRRYSYYNSIETEGLAYSLWIFFMINLIAIVYNRNKKNIVMAVVWSVLLISIRKQMLITLPLLFLCLIYIWIKNKKWKKAFLQAAIVVLVAYMCTKLLDCTYNYAYRGVFEPHTGDASVILGTEIYLANQDMSSYISDDTNKSIFMEIMNRADEQQYNTSYAGSGWQEVYDHYGISYEEIKFSIVNVVIREYQDSIGIAETDRADNFNEITSQLMKELLIPCLPGIIKIFVCNVTHGLITTVLKVKPVLNEVAVILYLVYFGILILLVRNKAYVNNPNSSVAFAVIVMMAMLINVTATSATIYPQMRYMLYNTGLFYQAGLIMLVELFKTKTGKV